MQVWEFHNIPAVFAKLDERSEDAKAEHPPAEDAAEPARSHDACFLPRVAHWTGDIQIHEMAWTGDDMIFINTLFSCLCRRSDIYNFEPVWRPSVRDQVPTGGLLSLERTRHARWQGSLRHGAG